jgi:hypothetical protein
MPLRQQELHTEGVLGIPTCKNQGDSNLMSMKAMQCILFYPRVTSSVTEIISQSMCWEMHAVTTVPQIYQPSKLIATNKE